MGPALFVRLCVCGSIYIYCCRALLVTGCTHLPMRITLHYSRITILLILPRREEDKESVQSAIGSRVFRAILPSSRALQAPCVAPAQLPCSLPMLPSILPGRNFILCSRGVQQIPVESPVLQKTT